MRGLVGGEAAKPARSRGAAGGAQLGQSMTKWLAAIEQEQQRPSGEAERRPAAAVTMPTWQRAGRRRAPCRGPWRRSAAGSRRASGRRPRATAVSSTMRHGGHAALPAGVAAAKSSSQSRRRGGSPGAPAPTAGSSPPAARCRAARRSRPASACPGARWQRECIASACCRVQRAVRSSSRSTTMRCSAVTPSPVDRQPAGAGHVVERRGPRPRRRRRARRRGSPVPRLSTAADADGGAGGEAEVGGAQAGGRA